MEKKKIRRDASGPRVATKQVQSHPAYRTPGLNFIPWRIDATDSHRNRLPAPGELMLWRFRAEWDNISRNDASLRMPLSEHHRAIRGHSPALGKRHLVSRAFLRNTLSRMLDRPSADINLRDHAEGELTLLAPTFSPELAIRITYAGIWVLLGISRGKLSVNAAVPHFHAGHQERLGPTPHPATAAPSSPASGLIEEVRDQTLRESVIRLTGDEPAERYPALISQNGAAVIAEANDGQYIHIVELPMPGQICAAVATYEPLSTIQAFGWRG